MDDNIGQGDKGIQGMSHNNNYIDTAEEMEICSVKFVNTNTDTDTDTGCIYNEKEFNNLGCNDAALVESRYWRHLGVKRYISIVICLVFTCNFARQ